MTEQHPAVGLERLPGALRSPWTWVAVFAAGTCTLLGIVMVVFGHDDVGAVVIGCVVTVIGVVGLVAALRAGVRVGEDGIRETPLFGRGELAVWGEVVRIDVVGNPGSVLPSRMPVVVRGSGDPLPLHSQAFYFRIPWRVRRLQAAVARMSE